MKYEMKNVIQNERLILCQLFAEDLTQKRLKTAEKKYFNQLSGAGSTRKLVAIHKKGEVKCAVI